jgi:hypothetical protein
MTVKADQRPRDSINIKWYARILAFFSLLAVALTAITFLVNLFAIPPSAYELNGGMPLTIPLATFVNGTWDHLGSNLYTMAFLLVGVLILPYLDSSLMGNRRYLRLVTWGQVAAGLLGAAWYYADLVVRRIGLDGAGSSIINGGLIGILILVFAFSALNFARHRRFVGTAILAIFLFSYIGEFVQGFLESGNSGAHFLGFVAGVLIAMWYLQT